MSNSWFLFPPFGDYSDWLEPQQEQIVQLIILGVGSLLVFLVVLYVAEKLLRVCWPNSIYLLAKRRLLRVKYTSSRLGLYAEMLYVLLSLYSCGLFVYLCIGLVNRAQSGDPQPAAIFQEPFVYWSEFVNSVLFGARYLFMLLTSVDSMLHLLHPFSISDQLTIIPGLIGPAIGVYYWYFLCLRAIQFYRSLRFLRGYGWKPLQTARSQLVFFFCVVFTYLFCATGILFVTENDVLNPEGELATLLDAFYLTVITLATVGYGDYTPKTTLGRLFVMILVVGALIIIPRETAKLIRIMQSQNTHKYVGEERHVVVYTQDGCDASTFLREFFYGRRAYRDTNVALVTTSELHPNTKELLAKLQYNARVEVLKGDLSVKETLRRANVSTANAVFLLAPKYKQLAHYHHADAQTILTALIVRTYNPNVEIFLQVASREHKVTALSRGLKHIVCVQELKLGLLALNCLYPGFSTLISNLVYNMKTDPEVWQYNDWLRSYDCGLNYHCYTEQSLAPLVGMTFTDAALYLFRYCQITLLGIKTLLESRPLDDSTAPAMTKDVKEPTVSLLLNPGRTYVIRDGDVGIIVATHEKALQRGLAQQPLPTVSTAVSSVELRRVAIHEDHKRDGEDVDATRIKQHNKLRQHKHLSKSSKTRRNSTHSEEDVAHKAQIERQSFSEEEGEYAIRSDDERTQRTYSNNDDITERSKKSRARKSFESLLNGIGGSHKKRQRKEWLKPEDPQEQQQHEEQRSQHFRIPTRQTRKKSRIIPKLKKLKGSFNVVFDETLIENYLFVEDEPTTLEKATLYTVEEHLKDHIVVICGPDIELYNLILPLRARYLRRVGLYKPIVLFSPKVPSSHVWNKLCVFPDIYFVRGSPTNHHDLLRAGVHNASQVLILGSFSLLQSLTSPLQSAEANRAGGLFSFSAPSPSKDFSEQIDSLAITAFKTIVVVSRGRVVPVVELMYHENSRFLMSYKDQSRIEKWEAIYQNKLRKKEEEVTKAGHLRHPLYSSGNLFYVSLFDTLICQVYYNIDLLDLLEEVISPETVGVIDLQTRPELFSDDSSDNITYGELFELLVAKEYLLPLGVYRHRNDIIPGCFVFTSPPFDTPLWPTDKVFVLQQCNKKKLALTKRL
jgi:voltage-gated potassium channel Kch